MSQPTNAATSSSKTKRAYRKGNPMSDSEKQLASVARKRLTHKEINVFVHGLVKDLLLSFCTEDGITQGQMIEKLIEYEAERRKAIK